MTKPLAYRVLWAMDPVQDDRLSLERSAVPFFKNWMTDETQIFPTHILGPAALNFPIGNLTNQWLADYREATRARISELLSGIKLSGLQAPEVMVDAQSTINQAVEKLLEYARGIKIDLIVVQNQRRNEWSRRFFGSFTDELVSKSWQPGTSEAPVMAVVTLADADISARAMSRSDERTILFPTDFGAGAKDGFRVVVSEAKKMRARVVLVHFLARKMDPMLESGSGFLGNLSFPVDASIFIDDWNRKRARARAWSRWASHEGIEVEVVVEKFALGLPQSIVKVAREQRADLIALNTAGGAPGDDMARLILHDKKLSAPVWLFHAQSGRRRISPERMPRVA